VLSRAGLDTSMWLLGSPQKRSPQRLIDKVRSIRAWHRVWRTSGILRELDKRLSVPSEIRGLGEDKT